MAFKEKIYRMNAWSFEFDLDIDGGRCKSINKLFQRPEIEFISLDACKSKPLCLVAPSLKEHLIVWLELVSLVAWAVTGISQFYRISKNSKSKCVSGHSTQLWFYDPTVLYVNRGICSNVPTKMFEF